MNDVSDMKIAAIALVWAIGLLLGQDIFSATAVVPPVKKSKSGICHDSLSPKYSTTYNYQSFETIDACLASGGRLPKNRMNPQKTAPRGSDDDDVGLMSGRTVVELFAGTAIIVGSYIFWRRRAARLAPGYAQGNLERRRWEGHKLDDEDMFKRRHHRWDPWLKKIGYFEKRK